MGESDSEDSDGEGGLGNVSRAIVRPPGTSGKAKRGHLCFDAGFESGNLGRADLIENFEYDLFLRPDTCNPRYRFWFNFTVDNVKQEQRVIFNIVNISNTRNLFSQGLTPFVKSSSRPKWQRISKDNVFYYRSYAHKNNYVLSFAFAFDKEDEIYQFAISPPYTYSHLQTYIMLIEEKLNEKRFTRNTLAKSIQNRNLELITIDRVFKNKKLENKSLIRVIVILARINPGDSPTSYICQGLIDFLIGNHSIANILRKNFIFKIIPMVNPDGVFLGNNRCNLIGQNLNYCWHIATKFSHPTIYAIREMLHELKDSMDYQLDFVIDLHSHTSLLGTFIQGNNYEDVYRYERHMVFPRLFANNTSDYCKANMTFNLDDRKIGTLRRYCCKNLGENVNSYTLEVSMGGYYLQNTKTIAKYAEEGYLRIGRNLVRTFLQYYRFMNILSLPIPIELNQKFKRPKTHKSQNRTKNQYEVIPRPKTTRCYAPISYNDFSICYKSITSDDESFKRLTGNNILFNLNRRPITNISQTNDQFSLLSIKSSKFDTFNFPEGTTSIISRINIKNQVKQNFKQNDIVNIPPRPFLSIIDFNQLTRESFNSEKKFKRNHKNLN